MYVCVCTCVGVSVFKVCMCELVLKDSGDHDCPHPDSLILCSTFNFRSKERPLDVISME